MTTHHLEMIFQETAKQLSRATGFIYTRSGVDYLVTNWHNVSGRHPTTGKCLSETLAVPDAWATIFRLSAQPTNRERLEVRLYADSQMQQPLWLEHPGMGSKVDVVALPLTPEWSNRYLLKPINRVDFDSTYQPDVADDVFVVGYPFDEVTMFHLPIWKRASVASEPALDIDRLPKLLVDTATRAGLSGSPVIAQSTGVHGLGAEGALIDSTTFGRVRNFLGVYSGRIGADEIKAQLGIVWKARVIDEIIDGRTNGACPH